MTFRKFCDILLWMLALISGGVGVLADGLESVVLIFVFVGLIIIIDQRNPKK